MLTRFIIMYSTLYMIVFFFGIFTKKSNIININIRITKTHDYIFFLLYNYILNKSIYNTIISIIKT